MITYLQTLRPIANPSAIKNPTPEQRFEALADRYLDRFAAEHGFSFEDLGVKVRITGAHGRVLVPWTAISYAEELPDPSTPTQSETAPEAAATPRAKRGGTKA